MADSGDKSGLRRYQDKVTIVTGGCKGMGRGIVDVFIDNGAKVVVLDVDDTTGNSLSTSGSGDVLFIHCDVTKEADIIRAIEQTVAKYGRIDCLINNAGWHPPALTIDHFSADDFRQLLELNLVGYFLSCKYALPYLRKVQGNIINNSSVNGLIGAGLSCTYSATKGGIIAMTQDLAVDESKHGVRVNAICPGPIQTPLLDQFLKTPEDKALMASCTLLNRMGKPSEIGQGCLFLAAEATYTTGTSLSCTAGMEVGFGQKSGHGGNSPF